MPAPAKLDRLVAGHGWLVGPHAGKVLTHRQLLTGVWGPSSVEQTHYLRVHIAHLRAKLEEDSAQPRIILTEPGVGYRLVEVN